MVLFFPDVSNHQGALPILPGTVAVFAKASQGAGFTDPYYTHFKAAAAGVGAVFVAYHWLDATDPVAQAHHAFAVVGAGTPLMIDVESGYGDPTVAGILAFTRAYRALGGVVTLVYLPRWYWAGHLGSPDLRPLGAARLGLIASEYRAYTDAGWPTGYGGLTPQIWQYTNAQAYAATRIDFNAYRGTVEQLRALVTGDDMALKDETLLIPSMGGAPAQPLSAAQALTDLWCWTIALLTGEDPERTPRFHFANALHQKVDRLEHADVQLTDAELTAIAAAVAEQTGAAVARLEDKLDRVLARLTAAGDALDG